jgi:hypothetical protein
LTQSFEERKLDCLALKSRQCSHPLLEKMAQIAVHKRIESLAARISWLLLELFAVTLLRTKIGLVSAQAVDGAAACDRY